MNQLIWGEDAVYWFFSFGSSGLLWAVGIDFGAQTSAGSRSPWEAARRIFSLEPGHWSCVSIQGPHPSEEHLKAYYVTTPREGCSNLKARPNAAHKCSFFSLFLEDGLLRSFVVSHIQRFFKEREKMATSRGVNRHFCGPERQKSRCKRKTCGDATRKCSKG